MNLDDVIDLDYEDFVKELKKLADDPKVQAILNSEREKIAFAKGTVPANKLIPMQKELIIEKSIKHELAGKDMKAIHDILDGKPVLIIGEPIITLNSTYIVDGHHRYVAGYAFNPNARMVVYDMKLNIEPIEALKIIQIAIAATTKDIPFSKPEGTDLYTMHLNDLKNYIEDNIADKVADALPYKTVYDAVMYILGNLILLKKHNKPISGAPTRLYMPQVSKAPESTEKLKKGKVNYKKPFTSFSQKFDDFLDGKFQI